MDDRTGAAMLPESLSHAQPEEVLVGPRSLPGELVVPRDACALIVFAHGSGSSRSSPRNIQVARALNRMGLGTLLFDLLDPQEALDRRKVFDIELLGQRVVEAIAWVDQHPALAALPLGLFGASTGAAAALVAAAQHPKRVFAVVSRGGRPDLAVPSLSRVAAPSLLIVGSADHEVLSLNQIALRRLGHGSQLAIVAGATHLFEEPGALEQVTRLAGDWFTSRLGSIRG
jgi:pimeloyl-ACP methyl ester carboxylesterase